MPTVTVNDMDVDATSQESESLMTPAAMAVFDGDKDAFKPLSKAVISSLKPTNAKPMESWAAIESSLEESPTASARDDMMRLPGPGEPAIASRFPLKDMKVYGAMPLREDPTVVACNSCGKPVLATNFLEHQDNCQKSLAKKADGAKNAAATANGDKKSKKRKAEEESADAEDKKKSSKKQKPVGRNKGPIDLDKQCGVVGPQEHACTRSLTCKSHSMSAKRAVVGRSQPYDILLSQYQKKNIGRPNKTASKPLDEDDNGGANVDSEEETSAILAALDRARMHPRPLARGPDKQPMFAKRRHQLWRIRDVLMNALEHKGVTGIGGGWAAGTAVNEDGAS